MTLHRSIKEDVVAVLVGLALAGSFSLAGCTWDQAQVVVEAGCAAGQLAGATAQANAAAVNKPQLAQQIAAAQALAATDCPAAIAILKVLAATSVATK